MAEGLSDFERQRLARIRENEKRLASLMHGVETSLLTQPKAQKKRTPVSGRKRVTPTTAPSCRRSGRISKSPAPLYYIEHDTTDSTPQHRRASLGTADSGGFSGRRCHGLGRGGTPLLGGDPWLAAPKGWKEELGCASLAAAEAATTAAVRLQEELRQQGRLCFVKLMSISQVSGGFWEQLPLEMWGHYGAGDKRTLMLHCFDKQHQDPDTFLYSHAGSSTGWPVVYLPRDGGAGLSGGWRGFAIDQRLCPNDTVLYEVLDGAPQPPASSSGDAPAEAASSAAGGGQPGGGGGKGVHPDKRAHMLAHIFRAADYEAGGAAAAAPAAAAAAAAPALDDDARMAQDRDGSRQQLAPSCCGSAGGAEAGTPAAAPAAGGDAIVVASDDDDGDDDGGMQDVPLAKRVKLGDATTPFKAAPPPAAAAATPGQLQQRGARVGDEGSLLAAAEGGLVAGIRIARQESSKASTPAPAAVAPAAAAASAGGATPQKPPLPPLGTPLRGGDSTSRSGTPAAGLRKGRAGCRAPVFTPGRSRIAPVAMPASSFEDASTAAPCSGGTAAAETPASGGRKRGAAAAPASGSGGRRRRSGGSSKQQRLIPKPANPEEEVPPPTQEEVDRDAAGGPFYVDLIVAHRVNAETQADEFCIRWLGFGPFWDSWEPTASLDELPGSYKWACSMPECFRV